MEVLGRGGNGYVYKVRDLDMGREALSAIKVLIPPARRSRAEYERMARAWRNEVRRATDIQHDNIVKVVDCGIDEERGWPMHFLKMELLEGVTLDRWARLCERSWAEILRVLVAVARGLAAVHDAGLVHRDVKPSDVFVGHDGRVSLMDFGLATTEDTISTVREPSACGAGTRASLRIIPTSTAAPSTPRSVPATASG